MKGHALAAAHRGSGGEAPRAAVGLVPGSSRGAAQAEVHVWKCPEGRASCRAISSRTSPPKEARDYPPAQSFARGWELCTAAVLHAAFMLRMRHPQDADPVPFASSKFIFLKDARLPAPAFRCLWHI